MIPLVFYYGDDEWDARLDIHGLLDVDHDSEAYRIIKEFIPNYKINLLDIKRIADTDTYEAARVLLGSDKELAPPKEGKEMVNMCEALQGIYQDGVSEGLQKGTAQIKAEVARGMRKEGISEEIIMRVTQLTKEELERIP